MSVVFASAFVCCSPVVLPFRQMGKRFCRKNSICHCLICLVPNVPHGPTTNTSMNFYRGFSLVVRFRRFCCCCFALPAQNISGWNSSWKKKPKWLHFTISFALTGFAKLRKSESEPCCVCMVYVKNYSRRIRALILHIYTRTTNERHRHDVNYKVK